MIEFCIATATMVLTLAGFYWALCVHKVHK